MPIYEYACNSCKKTFEYMQTISDGPKTECEECGGGLEKLISRSSFHLKGSGWYKDLYSSPPADPPPAKSSSDSSSSDSAASGAASSADSPSKSSADPGSKSSSDSGTPSSTTKAKD